MHRFELRGFRLAGLKLLEPDTELVSQHYSELAERDFYPALLAYIQVVV